MYRFLAGILFVGGALSLEPSGPGVALADTQAEFLARAVTAAEAGKWDAAAGSAAQADRALVDDIVVWLRLRDGVGTFEEYDAFLTSHADWPGLERLRRQGERTLPTDLDADRIMAYFDGSPPRSGTGAIRLATAHKNLGRGPAAEAEIIRAWKELSLSVAQEKRILEEWDAVVDPHDEARLDMLLWRGWHQEVKRMLRRVDADWRALAQARMATRNDAAGLQTLINSVPKDLRDNPGLAYERYLYRTKKGRWEEAEQFMLEHSDSAETLGRPDMWMPRRANLARQALRRGDVEDAYAIAAQNFGDKGADFADAEWLAGYVALMEQDDPKKAVKHFEKFRGAVSTPVSRGRAGFWLGLAHERAGDSAAASEAYAFGAQYQTSFYGQLAAARGDVPASKALAEGREAPDWRAHELLESDVVQAARLFILAGEDGYARVFLRHYASGKPAQVRAALAQMAVDLDRTHIAVRVAKDAAREGVIIPAQYYPLAFIDEQEWSIPTEYALAIARQESELNPSVVSSAGARGLMQLLPGTAEHVARDIGVPFSMAKLNSDPLYNARLGTEYLARNLSRFGGSYILATAAYNAGPGRVAQWLGEMGDPRMPDVDPIVWIESIPYSETRNYVMRVMEALHVYRARLNGAAEDIGLVDDINRTG